MIRIEVTPAHLPQEEAAIRALLSAHNEVHGWPDEPRLLQVAAKDEEGEVQGGLLARMNWRWCWVLTLAVAPAFRRQGLGARLLAAAEGAAREGGCVGIRLDTYSFQARGFYERQGYGLTGMIEDCPPGHTRYSLAKRLDGAAPPAEPWPDAAAPRASIALTSGEWEPALAAMQHGLDAHNTSFAGPHGFRPLNLVVRRPGASRPVGGLAGYRLYRWLFVRFLYLPADLRGGGLGAALLRRAEAEAAAMGCIGVWLDSFSFQARPFYEALGYRVFGTIEDFPPGHARHYLMKRLDAARGEG